MKKIENYMSFMLFFHNASMCFVGAAFAFLYVDIFLTHKFTYFTKLSIANIAIYFLCKWISNYCKYLYIKETLNILQDTLKNKNETNN